MRRRRIIHRSDSTQATIVRALRAVGASVDVIGEPVDLLVGFRGRTYLAEVKTPRTRHALTPQQRQCLTTWRGGPVVVWASVQDALGTLGLAPPSSVIFSVDSG